MKVRLDHCVVHVSAWQVSNDFYVRVLGVELLPRGEGWAYRLAGGQLNVHGPGMSPHPVARVPVQPGGTDVCFEWPGPIEGAIEHLAANQVRLELGPVPRVGARGQGTSVYFRDPDGSLLEFISYGAPA